MAAKERFLLLAVHGRHVFQGRVLPQHAQMHVHPGVDVADHGVGLAAQPLLDLIRQILRFGPVVEVPDRPERDQGHHQHGQEKLGENAETESSRHWESPLERVEIPE
jgi:hypothetical protein